MAEALLVIRVEFQALADFAGEQEEEWGRGRGRRQSYVSRFERSTGKHQHPAEAHLLAVVVVEALLAVQFCFFPPCFLRFITDIFFFLFLSTDFVMSSIGHKGVVTVSTSIWTTCQILNISSRASGGNLRQVTAAINWNEMYALKKTNQKKKHVYERR